MLSPAAQMVKRRRNRINTRDCPSLLIRQAVPHPRFHRFQSAALKAAYFVRLKINTQKNVDPAEKRVFFIDFLFDMSSGMREEALAAVGLRTMVVPRSTPCLLKPQPGATKQIVQRETSKNVFFRVGQ